MSLDARSAGLQSLERSRRVVLALISDIPEESLTHQVAPGANHPLWVLGHLTWTDDTFLSALKPRASVLPPTWAQQFGMKSTPVADPAAYPPLDEVRQQAQNLRDELLAWFRVMTDEELARPLPGDFGRFASNHAVLACSLAWHEGLHGGQLSVARRALGMAPRFA